MGRSCWELGLLNLRVLVKVQPVVCPLVAGLPSPLGRV